MIVYTVLFIPGSKIIKEWGSASKYRIFVNWRTSAGYKSWLGKDQSYKPCLHRDRGENCPQ